MNRRTFIAAAAAAASARGFAAQPARNPEPFVGVQLGAHSVYDEGVNLCLDILQENARVNAVFVYAYMYQAFSKQRGIQTLADHGVPLIDPKTRTLPAVWVRWHERYYKDTSLRHHRTPSSVTYHDKDVFQTLLEPAEKRGIQVFARILAPDSRDMVPLMPEWEKVACRDHLGRVHHQLCFNHPEYQAWWLATVEDLFRTYPLAGLKWGYERCGPLSNMLSTPVWQDDVPYCFCEHCLAYARKRNVDPERAKQGHIQLYEFVKQVKSGKQDASMRDGILIGIMRRLMDYPEILAWERLYYQAREDLVRQLSAITRNVGQAEFGRHVWQMMSFDPIYRAAFSYEDIAGYHDFVKPVVYFAAAGARVRSWALNSMRKGMLREVPDDRALQLLYDIFGLDNEIEPDYEESKKRGWTPDYVYRETKCCVDSVKPRSKVYSGIGIDIAGHAQSSNPGEIEEATLKALEAGADGLLISREYDEMRISILQAVGKAVKQVGRIAKD